MRFLNGYIYRGIKEGFSYGGFEVKKASFSKLFFYDREDRDKYTSQGEYEDLEDGFVIPGLVDLHIHGAMGADFSRAKEGDLYTMGSYLLSRGVCFFAAASMTLPEKELERAYKRAADFYENTPGDCARLMGIYMEGPFLSAGRKGSQNSRYIMKPDIEMVKRLDAYSKGLLKVVCIAPELYGAMDFIKELSKDHRISLAHTETDYEKAALAFELGAREITHLYNAMLPLHHRNPGLIAAGAEREEVRAELICDGIHVHPSMVRAAFKLFPGRICLISDATSALGMKDGIYELGGLKTSLKGRKLLLNDGSQTIAGSATDLYDCMLNAVKFGISKEEAIYSASLLPAEAIGCDHLIGSIHEGKLADFILCDKDLKRRRVYHEGIALR